MHSADYAAPNCPSVSLSVTRRYFVETVIHILKLVCTEQIKIFYGTVADVLQYFKGQRKIVSLKIVSLIIFSVSNNDALVFTVHCSSKLAMQS